MASSPTITLGHCLSTMNLTMTILTALDYKLYGYYYNLHIFHVICLVDDAKRRNRCPTTTDGMLCWEEARAGIEIRGKCPKTMMKSVEDGYSFRICNEGGDWMRINKKNSVLLYNLPNDTRIASSIQDLVGGFTNYTPCIYHSDYNQRSNMTYESLKSAASTLKWIEVSGLIISSISLIIAIIIFRSNRQLQCDRTRIHLNLFTATLCYSILRLARSFSLHNAGMMLERKSNSSIIQVGKDSSLRKSNYLEESGPLYFMPVICHLSVTAVNYFISTKFSWLLCEGIYLNNVLAVSVFRSGCYNLRWFYFIGWGIPLVFVIIWVVTMTIYHQTSSTCWHFYDDLDVYWILEGPRLLMLLLNIVFLFTIIQVLITKLKMNENDNLLVQDDVKRNNSFKNVLAFRKSVKAAILLIPLLGLTHIQHLIPYQPKQIQNFVIYRSFVEFFQAYQGFFLALLYCFLNYEVRMVLRRRVKMCLSRMPCEKKNTWLNGLKLKSSAYMSTNVTSHNISNSGFSSTAHSRMTPFAFAKRHLSFNSWSSSKVDRKSQNPHPISENKHRLKWCHNIRCCSSNNASFDDDDDVGGNKEYSDYVIKEESEKRIRSISKLFPTSDDLETKSEILPNTALLKKFTVSSSSIPIW
ncbi:hypothetical protein SNEBB_001002 [Seison nebaliae]|nr:hypothetical protein SNEBB_001002 [Seison nebaliae]